MSSFFYFNPTSGGLEYVKIDEETPKEALETLEEYMKDMFYIPKLIHDAQLHIEKKPNGRYVADLWAFGSDGSTHFDLFINSLPAGDDDEKEITMQIIEILKIKISEEIKKKIFRKSDVPYLVYLK